MKTAGGSVMVFDIKTLMFLNLLINLINAGTMFGVWLYNRKRYSGIFFWFVNMILQAVGTGLILLRGQIPDLVSIIAANFLLLFGEVLLFKGLGNFAGKKISMIPNFIVLTAFLFLSIFFTVTSPDITIRYILISAAGILVHIQICMLLFFRIDATWRKESMTTGILFLLFIIASFFRILVCILFPQKDGGFFDSTSFNSLVILFYITLSACLNICLTLMVNHRLVRELKIQEEKFSVAFHSSPYAMLVTRESDGYIYEVNDGFLGITGYQNEEVIGKTTLDIRFWVSMDNRKTAMDKIENKEFNDSFEFQFHKKSGEIFIGRYTAKIIRINNEDYVLSSISDITEFNQMKIQLEEIATHDFLTGLPNRMSFYSTFQSTIPEALMKRQILAVILLDLDNFKGINDQYGHSTGDSVLVEIGRRLQSLADGQCTPARLGGDEFILLVKDAGRREKISEFIKKVLDVLVQPLEVGKYRFQMTVSIGIALFPEDATDMEALIFKSDEAMYYVKAHGKNTFKFYSEIK